MMPDDGVDFAEREAVAFDDERITHAWDPERRLGDLYAKTLSISATVWDSYLIYGPGAKWVGDEPPAPAFWMHQLGASCGAHPDLLLNPAKLCQELVVRLEAGVQSGRPDLGLVLHAKGLSSLTRERP